MTEDQGILDDILCVVQVKHAEYSTCCARPRDDEDACAICADGRLLLLCRWLVKTPINAVVSCSHGEVLWRHSGVSTHAQTNSTDSAPFLRYRSGGSVSDAVIVDESGQVVGGAHGCGTNPNVCRHINLLTPPTSTHTHLYRPLPLKFLVL